MKAFEFEDQWGGVTRVRLVRGAYADGSLAVQALREGDGYWEQFAALTVNLCDERNQNASFAFVDTNNLPTAPEFLVENGLAAFTGACGTFQGDTPHSFNVLSPEPLEHG